MLSRLTPRNARHIVSTFGLYALLLVTLLMSDELLLALETKLDRLILLTQRLQHENIELKARESDWLRERVRLVEKNDIARSRVEAMISHLKSLDTE
jgi:cell division protein ZapB